MNAVPQRCLARCPPSFTRRPLLYALARQRQKAVELGEQQRAEMELGIEIAAGDQADDLRGRHQLHGDARFRLEAFERLASLDEA